MQRLKRRGLRQSPCSTPFSISRNGVAKLLVVIVVLKTAYSASTSSMTFHFIYTYSKLVFTIVYDHILIHTNYLQENYTLYKRKNN